MRISIITPTYNRCEMLEEAIQNVMAQDYPLEKIEHIIVDGASTDGTLEMLKKYPHLHVTSEPDDGVYDGMNKGIRQATGDIIILLNSDDILYEGALQSFARYFEKYPGIDTVGGGAFVFRDDTRSKEIYNTAHFKALDENNIFRGPLYFNARAYKRSVFDQVGLMDPSYKIFSDRDFVLRLMYQKGLKHAEIDALVYGYRAHDGSLTFKDNAANKGSYYELLCIAHDGIKKYRDNDVLLKAYKRWLAWSVARYLVVPDHKKNKSTNWDECKKAFKTSPFWPLQALYQIGHHVFLKKKTKRETITESR